MVECESTLMQTSFLVHIVLIDTWWNVNDFDIFRYANLFGFNRYMVECESVQTTDYDIGSS